MIALRFILVSAILISSTMAKPKSYMSDGDSQGEQKSTISAILQHLRHLYDIVNGNSIKSLLYSDCRQNYSV